jgi:PAS domain S-box-containing protein
MTDFFKGQMDYIFFFYGLAFIMLSVVCFMMTKAKGQRIPWVWLALFGVTHGLHEWVEILADVFGGRFPFRVVSPVLLITSYVALAEFGREAIIEVRGRGPGKMVFIPLLLITAAGGVAGLGGIEAASRFFWGLPAGILSSCALLFIAREAYPSEGRWLTAGGVSLGAYALLTVFSSYDNFLLSSLHLNDESFLRATGLPVELARGLLASLLALSVWAYAQVVSSEPGSATQRQKNTFVPAAVLLMILVAGWVLTEVSGRHARTEERKEGALYANMLSDHLADVQDDTRATAYSRAESPRIEAALSTRNPRDVAQARRALDQCGNIRGPHAPLCYLYDRKGNIVASCSRAGGVHEIPPRAGTLFAPSSGYFFDSARREWFYRVAAPVREANGGLLGTVVIEENLEDVEALLRKRSYSFFVDPHGTVFLSSDEAFDLKSLWPVDANSQRELSRSGRFGSGPFSPLLQEEALNGRYADFEGKRFYVSRIPVGSDGWSIVLLNSGGLVNAYRLFSIFTTFSFFSLTVAFFSLMFFTRESSAKIAASERRYRSLVEGSPNGVALFGTRGECLAVNRSALDMIGMNEKDVVGKSLGNLWGGEGGLDQEEVIAKVLRGERVSFDTNIARPDGKRMIWNVILNPIRDPEGGTQYFVGIFIDITALKIAAEGLQKAKEELEIRVEERTAELAYVNEKLMREIGERELSEEALKVSEEKYKNLVELTPDIISLSDIDGHVIFINSACRRILDVPPEEVIGKSLLEWVHPGDKDMTSLKFSEILDSGQDVSDFENRFVSRTGRVVNMLHNISVIKSERGEILGIQTVTRDVTMRKLAEEELSRHRERLVEMVEERTTELQTAVQFLTQEIGFRKKAEETLTESEAKFRELSQQFHTLLDAIPDVLLLLSPDLKVLWANSSARRRLGEKVSEMKGTYCYELWHGSCNPCEDCHVLRAFRTGEAAISQRAADGRLFDSKAFPIKDEEGRVTNAIIVVSDITEKMTLEAEAMRAGHLASLGELAAGVAHEINNPINGIINYAQIILNKSAEGTREHEIATRVMKEGKRIAGIVRSLLSFARERKEEKSAISVRRVLYEAITLMEAQIRKDGIHLNVDVPEYLPPVVANPQQLQQVFLNVVSNARYALNKKYAPSDEDKILTISCEEIMMKDSRFLELTFFDRGTGIHADIIDKVLNPFFSTKPSGEGTGLGLSISHGIVKDHGGRLVVESEEGIFTKVSVCLPVKEENGK